MFRMKFPDGTFWDFGSRSRDVGDFGTDYPTLFEDSNGNQVKAVYQWGTGRLTQIEDVRAVLSGGNWATYDFAYDNSTTPPHLTGITNRIGTSEGYTFNYSTATLTEPFTGTAWPNTGANTKFLTGMTVSGVGLSYGMTYQGSWTGELAKVTLPYGGYVRWNLTSWNYTASRTQREVSAWIHSKDGTAGAEKSYGIGHEANDGTRTLHSLYGRQ